MDTVMDVLKTQISPSILVKVGGVIFAIAAAIDAIVHSVSL
jgi:hypothetical protein